MSSFYGGREQTFAALHTDVSDAGQTGLSLWAVEGLFLAHRDS